MTPRIIVANLSVRLKSFYRERSAMFFTFAFPVILVLVFGTIFTKPEHLNFDLPVQDNSRSEVQLGCSKSSRAAMPFTVTPVPVAVDPTQYAREHGLNLLLVIPKDFEALQKQRVVGPNAGVPMPLEYVYDPSSTAVDTKIRLLDTIVAAANQKATGSPPAIKLVAQSILSERYRFIEFFVPGIIAMAIMTSCLSNALNMNAELRQKGILRKLATTPITRADWARVEHRLSTHPVGHLDSCHPAGQLHRVRRPTAHRDLAAADPRRRGHSLRRHRNAAYAVRQGGRKRVCRRQCLPFSNDVPFRHVLSGGNDAGLSADVRQAAPALLRERGVARGNDLRRRCGHLAALRRDDSVRRGRLRCRHVQDTVGQGSMTAEKRILFICGSMNQTTQMHQISRHLTDYQQAFTPFYCDGMLEAMRRLNAWSSRSSAPSSRSAATST